MDHRVIGLVGASGGLGTSTLAVAVAVRAARRLGVCACLDGAAWSGGLDVTACLEHLPGLRLGDLAGAVGELDGAALLRALPSQDGIAVLAPGARPEDPRGGLGAELVLRALRALAGLCAVTVVDLGRPGWDDGGGLLEACTDAVVVAGSSARQLADAVGAADRLRAPCGSVCTGLVLRAGRRDPVEPEDVAVRLDLPLVAVLSEDGRVASDADRARTPGTRASSGPAVVADRVLDWVELSDPVALPVSA